MAERNIGFTVGFRCGRPGPRRTAVGPGLVDDRIRAAKACGLRNLPFEDFVRNEAWFAMVMVAQDPLPWTASVCLNGALAKAEPTALRYQLLHVAARIAQRDRDLYLRINATWPWRDALDAAFGRLRTELC